MRDPGLRIRGVCPFWHELGSDFPCMFPRRAYCLEPGGKRPKFLSSSTARRRCLSNFEGCEGFQRRARALLESLFPLSNGTLAAGHGEWGQGVSLRAGRVQEASHAG
jgi:hypothetical protein